LFQVFGRVHASNGCVVDDDHAFEPGQNHPAGQKDQGGGEEDDSGDAKVDGVDQLEAVITSVRSLGYGKWQIGLEDGAVWATTEAISARDPKVGQKIELKRAAMGSFMGKVDGGRAVRMKRIS